MRTLLRRCVTSALLMLAISGLAAAIKKQPATAADETLMPLTAAAATDGIFVTYFTTDVRCHTCRVIEDLTRRAVEERPAEGADSDQVIFRVVNIDRPQNRHYVDRYSLVSKSVIISRMDSGIETAWEEMDDIWLHHGDEAAFLIYIRNTVQALLDSNPFTSQV